MQNPWPTTGYSEVVSHHSRITAHGWRDDNWQERLLELGMVVHTCNSIKWEAVDFKFKARMAML
jgi:hypothetical protein